MRYFTIIIPVMHLLLFIAIGLDIPVFRQILAFIYLTFVPGYVFLKVLRLKELDTVSNLLLSVGLSVSLTLFVGLFTNQLYGMGLSEPLSTIPLTIIFSFLTLGLYFVSLWRDSSDVTFQSLLVASMVLLICRLFFRDVKIDEDVCVPL